MQITVTSVTLVEEKAKVRHSPFAALGDHRRQKRITSSIDLVAFICAEEPFMEADFDETQVLIRLMVDYANMAAKKHALLNRIEIVTSEKGVFFWKNCPVATSMLPRYCLFALSGACRT
ncbi:hypothetical protein OUZ56_019964 [Daphnia magna]|uniref:Uncharacterized protein n=1 Tax=Daphnia magna TaxID=35525 RepID=A0ABQ9ZD46_9CRUS|nr:hypothetical protein OUZ56_019964 [Daphnia magna]